MIVTTCKPSKTKRKTRDGWSKNLTKSWKSKLWSTTDIKSLGQLREKRANRPWLSELFWLRTTTSLFTRKREYLSSTRGEMMTCRGNQGSHILHTAKIRTLKLSKSHSQTVTRGPFSNLSRTSWSQESEQTP
jgi:hypothetical protein